MSKNTNIAEFINYVSIDGSGNVVATTGIKKSGGTSSQFLKADGSVDASTYATQTYVTTAISNLVASSPATLDTLNELATALGNDANFATTVATSIGTKLPSSSVSGTINYIPKFTSASTIGNSKLIDDGVTLEYSGSGFKGLEIFSTNSSTSIRLEAYIASANADTGIKEIEMDGYYSSFNSYFGWNSSGGEWRISGHADVAANTTSRGVTQWWIPTKDGTYGSFEVVPYYSIATKYLKIAANGITSLSSLSGTGNELLKTSSTGVLSRATAGTDYVVPGALSSYLPLAGGTLTGNLTIGGFTIAELGTGYKGIQLQDSTGGLLSGSSYAVYLTSNAIIGTTGWIRGGAAYATARYSQFDGQHIFYTAAASSAGSAITWNTVFTIASTGAATFSNSITAGTYNLNSGGVVNINSQNGFQLGADTYSGGFYIYDNTTGVYRFKIANGGAVTISGILGIGVSPSYPLDMLTSSSGTFNTIAQFQNNDYTANNRSFIRVRQWVNAGGSSSSYFGTGQDSNLYIIANNSARGGDLIINAGTGDATFSSKLGVGVTPYSQLSLPSGNGWNGGLSWNYTTNGADSRRWWINTDQIVYGDFRICTEQTRGGGTINSAGSLYERFYIDASGRTGIGTTSLNASGLTIYQAGSDQRVLLELNRPNNSGLQTSLQFTVGNSIMVGQIQHEYAASNQNHMSFSLRSPSGSNFVSMWLKNDGNIGMGTNNPYTRLDVRGSIGMGGGATYPLNARLVKQGSTSVTFTATLGTIGAWRPGHIMIKVSGGQNGLQEYWAAWFFVRIIAYVGSSVICTVVDSGGDTGSVSFSSTSDASNSPQTATFTLTDGGGTTNTMIADIDLTYNEGIVSLS